MKLPWRMHQTIIWSSLSTAVAGVPGAFMAHGDVMIIAAIWTTMLIALAKQSGATMEKAKAAKIIAGVLAGIGGFAGGVKLANTYFAYTGVGTVPAMIINAGANAILTYLFGKAVARVFLSDGSERPAEVIIGAILTALAGGFGVGAGNELS